MRDRRRLGMIIAVVATCVAGTADATPLGSEFQVNSYTVDDQADRSVSVSASEQGAFVATWNATILAPVNSVNDVAARRFESSGSALGGDFAVNTYTVDEQGRRSLAVASDPSGNFVVVWSSYAQDGYAYGVFGQRYASDGAAAGNEFQVNTFTAFDQGKRQIGAAADGAGNFIVAWPGGEQDGDGSGVFARRFDSTGAPLGSEFQANSISAGEQGAEGVAVAASRLGDFVVAWNGPDGVGSYGVFARRFSSAGAPIGNDFQVNQVTAGDQGIAGLALASDGRGDVVVTWTGDGDGNGTGVFARRYSSSGAALGNEFQVNTATAGNQGYLGLAAASDPAGNFVVAWHDGSGLDGYNSGVFAQRFDAGGVASGAELQVNTTVSGNQGYRGLSATASGLGDFLIAWGSDSDQDGDKTGAFAQFYDGDLCGSSPNPTCNAPTVAGKGKLKLRDDAVDNSKDQLLWKWSGGGAVEYASFGDPSATTTYKLCLYDTTAGTPNLKLQATIPPGGLCDGKPCWVGTPGKGWKYKDKPGSAAGVTMIKLKAGPAGRSKVLVKARGASIPMPTAASPTELLDQDTTVRVQLFSSAGACWDSTFATPASSSTLAQFKDKSE